MSKANIILTGFMGTGKSTVGKLLAKHLGYVFVDTDELIQERSGQTIPEIFQEKGEAAFREMEAEIALELGDREGLVVSTGGRLMLDPDNAAALGRNGRVFCLRATPEEIVARVSNDAGVERPLLEGGNPIERIVELMREREEGYARFPQLLTSGKTPEEVARCLLDRYQAD
jgi:shikimate kinase